VAEATARIQQSSKRIYGRIFPQGVVDLVRQVAIFFVAYYCYRLTRGWIDGPQGTIVAFSNARDLISVEQATGTFFEPALHHFVRDIGFLRDGANLLYMNAQTTIVLLALIYIYFVHNQRFYFVRNAFVVSMAIALVGYALFPTAPPRFFFAEYNFVDTVSVFANVNPQDPANALFNPYAAVPSMHCCFAILISYPLAKISKHKLTRVLWMIYPVIMVLTVIVTANHWWLDAALGGVTAAASFYAAGWLARARPEAWAFAPDRATA
jgi:hypothetical protein